MTDKSLILIPGNHDVRPTGNAAPGMYAQTFEFIADIGWQPLVVDDDIRCVFFCFNSSEEGKFARGSVSDDQRMRLAAALRDAGRLPVGVGGEAEKQEALRDGQGTGDGCGGWLWHGLPAGSA